MMDRGCPGQDRSNWTADDIFEVPCPTAARRSSSSRTTRAATAGLRHLHANPKQDVGCAAWCAAAEKCSVGRQWIEDDSLADTPAFGDPT